MSVDLKTPRIPWEEKKTEAVSRLKALGILPKIIQQFEQDGTVNVCEPPLGEFSVVEGEELRLIREFENECNALVYIVVRFVHGEIGKMDAYLFVGDYRDEWEMELNAAHNPRNGVVAYVYNHDVPMFSDMGYVCLERTPISSLIRFR